MDQEWSENYIEVKGERLHYTQIGGGDKPLVVLAHGFSDNGLCWTPVARGLEDAYDLILPDARGHGLSARVQPGERVDMASDLAGLIRELGLPPVVVGGHSMGASVSAEMAALHPDLARALILEDPAWFLQASDHAEKHPMQAKQAPNPIGWVLEIFGKPLEEMMAVCRAHNPSWQDAELRPWAESKQQFDLNFLQIENILPREWHKFVPLIQCPTLLITADPGNGALITPEIAEMVVDLNSKVQTVHVPGAGHNIRRENFQDFMRVVRDFLDNLEN